MRTRSFEYEYKGTGFTLELYIDAEIEYDYPTYSTEGYRGFSFSIEYPEDLMVTPEEHKRIDKEVAAHINENFIELWEGSYYGYY